MLGRYDLSNTRLFSSEACKKSGDTVVCMNHIDSPLPQQTRDFADRPSWRIPRIQFDNPDPSIRGTPCQGRPPWATEQGINSLRLYPLCQLQTVSFRSCKSLRIHPQKRFHTVDFPSLPITSHCLPLPPIASHKHTRAPYTR